MIQYFLHGALAQLGARHTGSVEATGSSPVCSIPKAFYSELWNHIQQFRFFCSDTYRQYCIQNMVPHYFPISYYNIFMVNTPYSQ